MYFINIIQAHYDFFISKLHFKSVLWVWENLKVFSHVKDVLYQKLGTTDLIQVEPSHRSITVIVAGGNNNWNWNDANLIDILYSYSDRYQSYSLSDCDGCHVDSIIFSEPQDEGIYVPQKWFYLNCITSQKTVQIYSQTFVNK